MKRKKIILIAGLVLAITSGIFVFEMPSSHSKPKERVNKVGELASSKKRTPSKKIIVENPYLIKLLNEYENAINDLMKSSQTPGAAIAIVSDTSIIYLKGFGVKAVGGVDSVDAETVFRLGSVSKCFAPILTGMLVQEHVLSWNDQVIKYVPDFALHSKEQTSKLSIKHVLSHTVGLPYHTYTNLVEENTPLSLMLYKLRDINMIGNVGKVYSYQNVAYSLISEVVHSATGKTYERLITERIFGPLQMSHASICYADIMSNDNVAKPHTHTRHGLSKIKISDTYYNVAPAGGVNASATDMALWIEALLGNRKNIVSDHTLDEIFTPVISAPSKNRNYRKLIHQTSSFYALGWRVLNSKTDTLFYHGGYVNGYRSELAINRRDKIGICILTNATGQLADTSLPYFFSLYLNRRDSIQQWESLHHLKGVVNSSIGN